MCCKLVCHFPNPLCAQAHPTHNCFINEMIHRFIWPSFWPLLDLLGKFHSILNVHWHRSKCGVWVCVCVQMCVCVFVFLSMCLYVYVCVSVFMCVYVYVSMNIFVSMCVFSSCLFKSPLNTYTSCYASNFQTTVLNLDIPFLIYLIFKFLTGRLRLFCPVTVLIHGFRTNLWWHRQHQATTNKWSLWMS